MGIVSDELEYFWESTELRKAQQAVESALVKLTRPGRPAQRNDRAQRAGRRDRDRAAPRAEGRKRSGQKWTRGRGRGMNQLVSDAQQSAAANVPKPIKSAQEDSLPAKQTQKLAREGWDYHDGKWWPPGHPQNQREDTKSQHPDEVRAAPKEVKRTAMNVLRVLGYGKGSPEDRLTAFQRKHGIDQTGQPDRATLVLMRAEIAKLREKRAKAREQGKKVPKKRDKTLPGLNAPDKKKKKARPKKPRTGLKKAVAEALEKRDWGPEDEKLHPRDPHSGEWIKVAVGDLRMGDVLAATPDYTGSLKEADHPGTIVDISRGDRGVRIITDHPDSDQSSGRMYDPERKVGLTARGSEERQMGPVGMYADRVDKKQKAGVKLAAKKRGKDVEEFKREETERVRELLAPGTAKIAVRTTRKILGSVLRAGRFKTQHENNRSKGLLNADFRRTVEQNALGVPQDAPAEGRPVYGYVTDADEKVYRDGGFLNQYGDAVVVLKDSVRDRTTVSGDDSLDMYSTWRQRPMPINEADWRIGSYEGESEFNYDSPASEGEGEKLSDRTNFMEAQVHGGVTVDDIDHVEFGTEPEPRIKRALKKAGIEYIVKDEGDRRATLKWLHNVRLYSRVAQEDRDRIAEIDAGTYKPSKYDMEVFMSPNQTIDENGILRGKYESSGRSEHKKLTKKQALGHKKQEAKKSLKYNEERIADAQAKIDEYERMKKERGPLRDPVDVKSMGNKKIRDWLMELWLRRLSGEYIEHLLQEAEEEGGGRGKRDNEGMGVVVPGSGYRAEHTWRQAAREVYDRMIAEGLSLPDWESDEVQDAMRLRLGRRR